MPASGWRRTGGHWSSTPACSPRRTRRSARTPCSSHTNTPTTSRRTGCEYGLEANPAAELWAPRSVADQISAAFPGRVHTVGHGDAYTVAGFDVRVHGELHAVIHPDLPRVTNVGYLVDGSLFHPGDALTVPDQPVDTLLLPLQAPWSKASEVIDYLREVKPVRAYDIHDVLLAEPGLGLYGSLLGSLGGTDHSRLAPGASVDV